MTHYGLSSHKRPLPMSDHLSSTFLVVAYGRLDCMIFNCFAEYIFAAVLGLYMDEEAQSLPKSDEVLICSSETTSEEVLTSSLAQKHN